MKINKNLLKVIGIVLLLIAALMFLTSIVNATIVVTPFLISNSSIGWNWTPCSNTQNISIDGLILNNIDTSMCIYIGGNYLPNTEHIIDVHSSTDYGSNITSTLPEVPTSTDNILNWIYPWLPLIIGFIFCLIGLYVDFAGLIGSIIGLLGLIMVIPKGVFITDIMYAILIFAGILTIPGFLKDG